MTATELRGRLEAPFGREYIKKRKVGRDKQGNDVFVDFIDGGDVIQRINQATEGTFDWKIKRCELIFAGQEPAFWLCEGTLVMPQLGERDATGTHPFFVEGVPGKANIEAPKTAETDALKRAARLFGVALQLWCEDAGVAQTAAKPAPAPVQAAEARKEVPAANSGGQGKERQGEDDPTKAGYAVKASVVELLMGLGRPFRTGDHIPERWHSAAWAEKLGMEWGEDEQRLERWNELRKRLYGFSKRLLDECGWSPGLELYQMLWGKGFGEQGDEAFDLACLTKQEIVSLADFLKAGKGKVAA